MIGLDCYGGELYVAWLPIMVLIWTWGVAFTIGWGAMWILAKLTAAENG